MRESGLRTTTGLMLSAVMLLGNIVPPGLGHAHAGGDVAHDHNEQCVHHHFHHGHDCHHHHHAADHHGLTAKVLDAEAVAHVHFAFWLLDLTLPVRDEFDTEEESVCIVRLIDDCLPTTIRGSDTQSIDFSFPSIGNSIAPATAATHRATTPLGSVILLCDVARHERSGVQLF